MLQSCVHAKKSFSAVESESKSENRSRQGCHSRKAQLTSLFILAVRSIPQSKSICSRTLTKLVNFSRQTQKWTKASQLTLNSTRMILAIVTTMTMSTRPLLSKELRSYPAACKYFTTLALSIKLIFASLDECFSECQRARFLLKLLTRIVMAKRLAHMCSFSKIAAY